jgi:hypothetical protein
MDLARLHRGFFTLGGAFLGGAGAYDSGGNQAVGMIAGALFGLLLGLVFVEVRGKWLDYFIGPEGDDEADEMHSRAR